MKTKNKKKNGFVLVYPEVILLAALIAAIACGILTYKKHKADKQRATSVETSTTPSTPSTAATLPKWKDAGGGYTIVEIEVLSIEKTEKGQWLNTKDNGKMFLKSGFGEASVGKSEAVFSPDGHFHAIQPVGESSH